MGGPPSGLPVEGSSVTFALVSDDAYATFACRVDGGAWAPCTSPVALSGLTAGDHELDARGTDAAGNTDATPAVRLFHVTLPSSGASPGPGGPSQLPGGASAAPKLTFTLAFFVHATARSTRFTRLAATGVPAGATTTATCIGPGCPRKKTFTSTRSGSVSLTPFRTTLRPGAKLTIRVTKPGAMGAVKVLTVRKSKAPAITTRCLSPGTTLPASC
jgi:hypothetical protein